MTLRSFCMAAVLLVAAPTHAEGPPAGTNYADYAQAFVDFYDASEGMDIDARVAAFQRDVAPLFPSFYAPRDGRTQGQVDANIRKAIEEFPSIREKYVAAERAFPEALARARDHFRQFFPDSTASLPAYLLHSLGEMDGGTREIDGRAVMVFGADGIARYHLPGGIGPFFDHEFFHVEHGAYFTECDAIWCSLWVEGLATAAAAEMNPGIGPEALMLTVPRPIPSEVDARWREALCYLDARKDSTEREDYRTLFLGNGGTATLPPRWGYYMGYRMAQRLLRVRDLVELAHLPNAEAEALIKDELSKMVKEAGGC